MSDILMTNHLPASQCIDNLKQSLISLVNHDDVSPETKLFLAQLVCLLLDRIEETAAWPGINNGENGYQLNFGSDHSGVAQNYAVSGAGIPGLAHLMLPRSIGVSESDREYLVDLDGRGGAEIRNLVTGRSARLSWESIVRHARDHYGLDD